VRFTVVGDEGDAQHRHANRDELEVGKSRFIGACAMM
jgi:hypothetical protein